MNKSCKQLFSRVIVLILAISSIQSGYAVELGDNSHTNDCEISQFQPASMSDFTGEDTCKTEHYTHCLNFLGCTSSLIGNSILSRNSYLEPARIMVKLGHEKNNSSLFTIYTELFKRPPIA